MDSAPPLAGRNDKTAISHIAAHKPIVPFLSFRTSRGSGRRDPESRKLDIKPLYYKQQIIIINKLLCSKNT